LGGFRAWQKVAGLAVLDGFRVLEWAWQNVFFFQKFIEIYANNNIINKFPKFVKKM